MTTTNPSKELLQDQQLQHIRPPTKLFISVFHIPRTHSTFNRLWGQPLRSCSWMVTRAPLHAKLWGSTIYACADIVHVGKDKSGNARQKLISSSSIMIISSSSLFWIVNCVCFTFQLWVVADDLARFGCLNTKYFLTQFSLHWVINQGSARLKQSTGLWSMCNFIISTFPSAIIQQPYILPARGLYHSKYHIRQDWPGLKQKQPFQP